MFFSTSRFFCLHDDSPCKNDFFGYTQTNKSIDAKALHIVINDSFKSNMVARTIVTACRDAVDSMAKVLLKFLCALNLRAKRYPKKFLSFSKVQKHWCPKHKRQSQ